MYIQTQTQIYIYIYIYIHIHIHVHTHIQTQTHKYIYFSGDYWIEIGLTVTTVLLANARLLKLTLLYDWETSPGEPFYKWILVYIVVDAFNCIFTVAKDCLCAEFALNLKGENENQNENDTGSCS